MKCYYVYICKECKHISYAHFFKRHKLGYKWKEKCDKCSIKLPDGQCKYTTHQIIGKMEKAYPWHLEK